MDKEKLYNWDMLGEGDDDIFYDIVDPPKLLGCLTRCLGGQVYCNLGKGRVIPSEADPEISAAQGPDGYLSWHRDTGSFLGSSFGGSRWPRERRIKVLTAIFDSPDAGTGLVPGSQLLPSPPERMLSESFLGGHGEYTSSLMRPVSLLFTSAPFRTIIRPPSISPWRHYVVITCRPLS